MPERMIPSPWKEFLGEIDSLLKEPLDLRCIGGFAFTYFYGLERGTSDLDYFSALPADLLLIDFAGEGSALHKKHKVCLHKAAVSALPEDYESRLTEMARGQFKNIRILIPDPYDCILSKLERSIQKDIDDSEFLFRSQKLDTNILRERYQTELRHNLIGNVPWHDRTLEMWIEIFEREI